MDSSSGSLKPVGSSTSAAALSLSFIPSSTAAGDKDKEKEKETKICEWLDCGASFDSTDSLVAHINEVHLQSQPVTGSIAPVPSAAATTAHSAEASFTGEGLTFESFPFSFFLSISDFSTNSFSSDRIPQRYSVTTAAAAATAAAFIRWKAKHSLPLEELPQKWRATSLEIRPRPAPQIPHW